MSVRPTAVAFAFALLAGCGPRPEGPPATGGVSVPMTVPAGTERRADAGKDVPTVGTVSAEVVGRKVGRASVYLTGTDGKTLQDDDETLQVTVRFSTSDPKVSKHSLGWLTADAKLTDEHGNTYDPVDVFNTFPVGTSANRVVRAGEPVVEVWRFEKPIPAAKKLTLEFSAACVELDGRYRLTIPME